MSEAKVGENVPPLHPWCRCTTVAVVEEENLVQAQPAPISKKAINNGYSVDRELVNSKKYHDKFEGLSGSKPLDEGLYRSSLEILEHRDGTPYEDVYLLDAKTGKAFVKATQAVKPFKSGLTTEQYLELLDHKGGRGHTAQPPGRRALLLNGYSQQLQGKECYRKRQHWT